MRHLNVIILLLLLLGSVSAEGQNRIVVSKTDLKLHVLSGDNDTIYSCRIGCGLRYGNKRRVGDMKTPEGTFQITQIQNSTYWTHDFHDGYGERAGAYGPFFFRLASSGWYSIGIHGTCFPQSIGTRCSEGCIRLLNDDVVRLRELIRVGTSCTIEPDTVTPKRSRIK